MSNKLVQQELSVGDGGPLDIMVTVVVEIKKFWINVRTTDILEGQGECEGEGDCIR